MNQTFAPTDANRLRRIRRQLVGQIGHRLSAVEKSRVSTAAGLLLRSEQLARDPNADHAVAVRSANAAGRALRDLGIERPQATGPDRSGRYPDAVVDGERIPADELLGRYIAARAAGDDALAQRVAAEARRVTGGKKPTRTTDETVEDDDDDDDDDEVLFDAEL